MPSFSPRKYGPKDKKQGASQLCLCMQCGLGWAALSVPAAGLLTPEALSGELVPEAGAGRVSPSW